MSNKSDYRLEKFDEYDEACQMTSVYCNQISQEQFEEQGVNQTDKALEDLLQYLDKNPEAYKTLLKKRKREEKENEGFMTALKLKFLGFIHGDSNYGIEVTNDECEEKLGKLKSEMQRAFDYSLKSKGSRYSERLAAKREKRKRINDENTPSKTPSRTPSRTPSKTSKLMAPPPPPPPPPIPGQGTPRVKGKSNRSLSEGSSPLRDINNQMNTPDSIVKPRKQKRGSMGSMTSLSTIGSLSSLHQEIMEFNPMQRLKSVKDLSRSPGGTPSKMDRRGSGSPSSFGGRGTPTEPLYRALVNSMQKKFRNVRSPPSPAGALYNNALSPASASVSPGFTP